MKISMSAVLPATVGVIGAAGLLAAVAVGAAPERRTTEVLGGGSNRPVDPRGVEMRTFSIEGDVDGLYPGATRPLVLTIRNPHPFAIRVTELDVTVADEGACSNQLVDVGALPAPVVVQRGASTTTGLDVSLDPDAPDACKNVHFDLTYRGLAERA